MDPVRETPKAHECVCLLIKGPNPEPHVIEAMEKAAAAAGIGKAIVRGLIGNKDKCHRIVDNPDQPFCDGCEDDGHPQLPNQLGMHNIVKEKSNDPATER